jgi:hypothetical protein
MGVTVTRSPSSGGGRRQNPQNAAGDGKTSIPADRSRLPEWCEEPSRAGCAKLSEAALKRPPERLEFQVRFDQAEAKSYAPRPAFRRRSRSRPWRIPGIPCLCHRGCGQRPEWPAAALPIFAARSRFLPRLQASPGCANSISKHLTGHNVRKDQVKLGHRREIAAAQTPKPAQYGKFPEVELAVHPANSRPPLQNRAFQK